MVQVLLSFAALPLMVVVIVPWMLASFLPITLTKSAFQFPGMRFLSFLFFMAGILLFTKTNILFIREGQGTLAPWQPPRKLIISGPYRCMRHPMITGVLCLLAAEIFLLGSWAAVVWFFFFLAVNLIYLPLVEEKKLLTIFGEDYQRYQRHVPAVFPRCKKQDPEK